MKTRTRNGVIVPLTAAVITEYLEYMDKDHGDPANYRSEDERL
jgi:hypothetical protein